MPTAYIALGANISGPGGPPDATLAAAVRRLGSLGRVVARSSLYSTSPVGVPDQPRFFNAVVAIETSLPPRELLSQLLQIERDFGRDRSASVPNGPRTLDLDILLYGSEIIHEPGLDIPHPRLAQRAFVLVPLADIASNFVVPASGRTVQQLLQGLRAGHFPDNNNAVLPVHNSLWDSGPCVGPDAAGGASA